MPTVTSTTFPKTVAGHAYCLRPALERAQGRLGRDPARRAPRSLLGSNLPFGWMKRELHAFHDPVVEPEAAS